MPEFHYKAINRAGMVVQGQITAVSQAAATELLADQGRFVNEISPVAAEPQKSDKIKIDVSPSIKTGSRRLRLSEKDRCEFIRQLATGLQAQLPILTALQVLGKQNPRPAIKQISSELTEIISSGKSLSFALAQYPRSFDQLHLSLVAVGETAGELEQCMGQLADLTERERETRSDIMTASMYPAFVLALGMLSITIVVTWILPQILSTLVTDPSVLPWPTRAVLHASEFLKSSYGMAFTLILFAVVLFLMFWKRTAAGQYVMSGLKLKIPVFGTVQVKWAVSRFARTLGTLTAGGVNILDALGIVRNCLGNEVLAREVDGVAAQVRSGSSLAGPLRESGRFPALLTQIVAMGEETGHLSELLLNTAQAFDRDTSVAVKRFMAVFPPLLIALLAVVIGFIVAATLLPIVQIETTIPGL